MKNIFFLHPGKANYPDIDAYKNYFKNRFRVYDGIISDYHLFRDKKNTILWCIMGFYPKKQEALYTIHDYRSLSVGRFNNLKDQVKKNLNYKPDLRVFLNARVKEKLSFNDEMPFCLLDMGVPEWIFDVKPHKTISGDYCYIGEMSYERKFNEVIDSFLEHCKENTFVLVGDAEERILSKYKKYKNLNFTGRVTQKEALSIVKACNTAVCYFPYHEPHCYQTPTKLLEYLALDVDVIFNDSPSNIDCIERYSDLSCAVKTKTFSNKEQEYFLFNKEIPRKIYNWNEVIKISMIDKSIPL